MFKEYQTNHEFSVHCLSCGRQIPYGRTDKKFCTTECKNKYHNTQRCSLTTIKQEVRQRLAVNYKVLKKLLSLGINNVSTQQAKDMGFDLRFITKVEAISDSWIFYCYDISYQVSGAKIVHITQLSQYAVELSPTYGFDKKRDDCCKNHGR